MAQTAGTPEVYASVACGDPLDKNLDLLYLLPAAHDIVPPALGDAIAKLVKVGSDYTQDM